MYFGVHKCDEKLLTQFFCDLIIKEITITVKKYTYKLYLKNIFSKEIQQQCVSIVYK